MDRSEPLTAVVGDAHAAVRGAVRAVLSAQGFVVVGEAADARTVVRLASTHAPHVCLLDTTLPGGGLVAAQKICAASPDVTVVMLTDSRDEADLFDAVRAGAHGYLFKDMDPDRLGPALHGVLSGETALPRTLLWHLLDELRGSPRRRVVADGGRAAEFTSREWEVMMLLREQLSTEKIARRLVIAPATVRVHISGALKKLHARDRSAAVRLLAGEAHTREPGPA